jgi:hypothetical protein
VPALALIPPIDLCKILEADDFKVVYEDQFNWWFARGATDVPFNVPKESGEDGNVSFDVMENALFEAQIDHARYFALRDMVFAPKKPAN